MSQCISREDMCHFYMVCPLDMDYLLAYQPSQEPPGQTVGPQELEVAPLTESQLERLQGLETKLQAVVVGYRKRKPSG